MNKKELIGLPPTDKSKYEELQNFAAVVDERKRKIMLNFFGG